MAMKIMCILNNQFLISEEEKEGQDRKCETGKEIPIQESQGGRNQ